MLHDVPYDLDGEMSPPPPPPPDTPDVQHLLENGNENYLAQMSSEQASGKTSPKKQRLE